MLSKMNNNHECVNGVMNTVEALSAKQMKKAFSNILEQTRSFSQCLKVFGGIMNVEVVEVNGVALTTEQILSRAVECKNGKLSPAAIKDAWADYLKDEKGNLCVYKYVTAHKNEVDPEAKKRDVYYWDEEAKEYKTVRRYVKVAIDANKWSAGLVLQGLWQTLFPEEVLKTVKELDKHFEELEEVYYFDKRTSKGSVTNSAMKIEKCFCAF